MLKNSKEELFPKLLCIQLIKKLQIKDNAHILMNYFYICFIKAQVNISKIWQVPWF